MANLLALADAFRQQARRANPPTDEENPPGPVEAAKFISQVHATGEDLSTWGEERWREALSRIGVDPELHADCLEILASYGMTDDHAHE